MKKFILSLFTAASIFSAGNLFAQSFSIQHDTVYATVSSLSNISDPVINNSNSSITVNWNIVATNFPSDWINQLGVCDNNGCYNTNNSTLWNGSYGQKHSYPFN